MTCLYSDYSLKATVWTLILDGPLLCVFTLTLGDPKCVFENPLLPQSRSIATCGIRLCCGNTRQFGGPPLSHSDFQLYDFLIKIERRQTHNVYVNLLISRPSPATRSPSIPLINMIPERFNYSPGSPSRDWF